MALALKNVPYIYIYIYTRASDRDDSVQKGGRVSLVVQLYHVLEKDPLHDPEVLLKLPRHDVVTMENEKSVGDLEELLGIRQSAVSQQLGRLRAEDMVRTRRSGKAIYYSLSDNRAIDAINCVLQHST